MKTPPKVLLIILIPLTLGTVSWFSPLILEEFYFFKFRTQKAYFLETLSDNTKSQRRTALIKFLNQPAGKIAIFKQFIEIAHQSNPAQFKKVIEGSDGYFLFTDPESQTYIIAKGELSHGYFKQIQHEEFNHLKGFMDNIHNTFFKISDYHFYVNARRDSAKKIQQFHIQFFQKPDLEVEDSDLKYEFDKARDFLTINPDFLSQMTSDSP